MSNLAAARAALRLISDMTAQWREIACHEDEPGIARSLEECAASIELILGTAPAPPPGTARYVLAVTVEAKDDPWGAEPGLPAPQDLATFALDNLRDLSRGDSEYGWMVREVTTGTAP